MITCGSDHWDLFSSLIIRAWPRLDHFTDPLEYTSGRRGSIKEGCTMVRMDEGRKS